MPQTNVKHWRRLDNAAKLFPAASSKRDTRVFRFYCELKEDIQQEILQKAKHGHSCLEKTSSFQKAISLQKV